MPHGELRTWFAVTFVKEPVSCAATGRERENVRGGCCVFVVERDGAGRPVVEDETEEDEDEEAKGDLDLVAGDDVEAGDDFDGETTEAVDADEDRGLEEGGRGCSRA